jgi:hypothetical protein
VRRFLILSQDCVVSTVLPQVDVVPLLSSSGELTAPALVAPASATTADCPAPVENATSTPVAGSSASTHGYGTRLQHNIHKPKIRTDGTVTYSAVRSSPSEPTSHVQALADPHWKQAMVDEYQALLLNKTWHLVPPQEGLNVIDCKWVFRLKQHPDGSLDRYKARLVAKGFK